MYYDRPVSLEAGNALDVCDLATGAFTAGLVFDHLVDAGQERYHVAHKLIEKYNPYERREGFLQFLELMMENPYSMIATLERLRATAVAVQIEPSDEERRRRGL